MRLEEAFISLILIILKDTYKIATLTLFIDFVYGYLNMSLGFIHGKWGSHGWTRGPFTLIVAVASGLQ